MHESGKARDYKPCGTNVNPLATPRLPAQRMAGGEGRLRPATDARVERSPHVSGRCATYNGDDPDVAGMTAVHDGGGHWEPIVPVGPPAHLGAARSAGRHNARPRWRLRVVQRVDRGPSVRTRVVRPPAATRFVVGGAGAWYRDIAAPDGGLRAGGGFGSCGPGCSGRREHEGVRGCARIPETVRRASNRRARPGACVAGRSAAAALGRQLYRRTVRRGRCAFRWT
jgi:hypothetical protein